MATTKPWGTRPVRLQTTLLSLRWAASDGEFVLHRAKLNGNHSMDACLETLASLCPEEHGTSFRCMACADKHRDAVTKGCGT